MRTGSYTQFDLLRHGELQLPGLFCANSDQPLSARGVQQLEKATRNKRWDGIVCSPAIRCHTFARMLAQQQACPLQVEPDLKEMDFGRWTDMKHQAVWQQDEDLLTQLWTHPESFIAPEGEAMKVFIHRVEKTWYRLLAHYTNQSMLLLTHAGVIRVILALALQIPHQRTQCFAIPTACFTRLRYYPDGVYSLISHGVSQLENEDE